MLDKEAAQRANKWKILKLAIPLVIAIVSLRKEGQHAEHVVPGPSPAIRGSILRVLNVSRWLGLLSNHGA